MGQPIAVLTSTTGTGDLLTSPGCPTVLCSNKPVATLGTMVSGAACVGTAAGSPNAKILIQNKPVLHLTSTASGSNPATGAPVTTPVSVTTAVTILA